MFDLSNFYAYCNDNDIDVIPYCDAPSPGITIRDQEWYAIFLDVKNIRSLRALKGICAHELGHASTGSLHKINSPYETVERSEYRANKWSAENILTEAEFREAFSSGYTELWQLADYFDLPEQDIKNAYPTSTVFPL